MTIFIRIIVFAGLLFFSSCTSQKVLNRYAGTQIIFGDGGGFTRQTSEYVLNTNGEIIYVETIQKDTVLLPPVSKKITANIYKKFSESGVDTMNFKHPGDKYYFIKNAGNNTQHEIIWGDPSYQVPAKVDSLYKLLMSTVRCEL